jgi:hypothetical protein
VGIRTWTRLAGNSFGAAAIVAAAQLGIGYGLHIVDWGQRFDVGNDNAWSGLLTWTAFITAVAVLGGAAAGGPGIARRGRRVSLPARLTAAVAASLGALAAVPLAWLPARVARPETSVNPGMSVLMAAGAGAVVGLLVALAALSAATVAGGLAAAVTWVWAGALASAAVASAHGDPLDHPRLGLIEVPRLVPSTAWWFGPEMLVGVGVALSAAVAALARRRGMGAIGVICSGLAGPALIAAAYIIAGPGVGSYQRQPYLAAMLGAGAGFVASLLVAVLRPRRRAGSTGEAAASGATAATGTSKGAKAGAASLVKATKATPKASAPAAAATTAAATKAPVSKPGKSAAPVPAGALAAAKSEPGHTSVFRVQLDTLERPSTAGGNRGSRDPVKASDRKPAARVPAAATPAATAPSARPAPAAQKAAAPAKTLPAERPPAEPVRTGRGRSEPAKTPPKVQPVKAEPTRPEPARAEPARPQPAPSGSRKGAKPEPSKPAPSKPEPAKPEVKAVKPEAKAAAKPDVKSARPDVKSVKPENGKPEPAKPEPSKPKAKRAKAAPKVRAARARGRQAALRQHELDHINWVRELVRTPDSPDLAGHPD